MSFQDGIHARLQHSTCHHLENIAPEYRHQLFTISFMNPHDFIFLPELSTMYWVGDLAHLSKGRSGDRNQTIILSWPYNIFLKNDAGL